MLNLELVNYCAYFHGHEVNLPVKQILSLSILLLQLRDNNTIVNFQYVDATRSLQSLFRSTNSLRQNY
jgi:hypothetical protein